MKLDFVLAVVIGMWALTAPYDASSVVFGFSAGIFFQEFWRSFLDSRAAGQPSR